MALVFVGRIVAANVREMHPPRVPLRRAAGKGELASFEDVRIRAEDGVSLAGWWSPPRNGVAVVLVHGHGANREQMLGQALPLAEYGFGVLLLDLRAHGESDGGASWWGDRERLDVSAAVDFAASRRGVGAIGIVGFSIGALAAGDVALADSRIRAVVLEAMLPSLEEDVRADYSSHGALSELPAVWAVRVLGADVDGVRPGKRLCELAPRPLLLVYGEKDPEAPRAVGERLLRTACGPAALWIVSNGDHGHWGAGAELGARVVRFFSEAFAPRQAGALAP